MMSLQTFREALLLTACALLAFAMLRDIAFRSIPNMLCAAVASLALVMQAVAGDVPRSLIAGLIVFAVCVVCWLRGWLGGGDVKLLSAVALLPPPGSVPHLLANVAVAGGLLAACYLLLARIVPAPHGRAPMRIVPRILRAERWRISGRRSLPYGCAITLGAFVTLLNG